jgi:uncharacterized delta-60 repeat protein
MKLKKVAFLSIFIVILSVFSPLALSSKGSSFPNQQNTSISTSSTANNDYSSKLNITWDASNIDSAPAITVDNAGNIYITGYYNNSDQIDSFIAKYNKDGNLIFNSTWGTNDSNDFAQDIAVDDGGNIYITGYNQTLTYDAFIAKFNSGGECVKNITWDDGDYDQAYAINLDNEGNIYIAGRNGTLSMIFTYYDAFVAKFNNAGECVKNFTWNLQSDDKASDLEIDDEGNIYITGETGLLFYDIFLVKFNTTGGLELNKTFDFSFSAESNGLALDDNNNIYIAGTNISSSFEAFIKIFNSTGESIRNITDVYNSTANAISLDNAGNIYITGTIFKNTATDAYITKFNSTGGLLVNISHHFSSSNSSAMDIYVSGGGNIYITGYNNTDSSQDIFIAKYALPKQGFFLWIPPVPSDRIPGYSLFSILSITILLGITIIVFLKHNQKILSSN